MLNNKKMKNAAFFPLLCLIEVDCCWVFLLFKTACKRKSKEDFIPAEEQETDLITILFSLLSVLPFIGGTTEMSKGCRGPAGHGQCRSFFWGGGISTVDTSSFLQSNSVDVGMILHVSHDRLCFAFIKSSFFTSL